MPPKPHFLTGRHCTSSHQQLQDTSYLTCDVLGHAVFKEGIAEGMEGSPDVAIPQQKCEAACESLPESPKSTHEQVCFDDEEAELLPATKPMQFEGADCVHPSRPQEDVEAVPDLDEDNDAEHEASSLAGSVSLISIAVCHTRNHAAGKTDDVAEYSQIPSVKFAHFQRNLILVDVVTQSAVIGLASASIRPVYALEEVLLSSSSLCCRITSTPLSLRSLCQAWKSRAPCRKLLRRCASSRSQLSWRTHYLQGVICCQSIYCAPNFSYRSMCPSPPKRGERW